jgi:hypothetical protein
MKEMSQSISKLEMRRRCVHLEMFGILQPPQSTYYQSGVLRHRALRNYNNQVESKCSRYILMVVVSSSTRIWTNSSRIIPVSSCCLSLHVDDFLCVETKTDYQLTKAVLEKWFKLNSTKDIVYLGIKISRKPDGTL